MSSLQELEKYEIDVQALMRGIVHELRNPLSAILTAANLLSGGQGDEEESTMLLEILQKEARRMNRILTEFSHFARPPAPHVLNFDLAQLAHEVVNELKNENILGEHIEVLDRLPEKLDVAADPQQTQAALRNVLENAVESLERGGKITLGSSPVSNKVALFVEDNGSGVSSKALTQAFQPFFSTKPASTGLGLSIARMSLRASGGDVKLENLGGDPEAPTGMRATIELPASVN